MPIPSTHPFRFWELAGIILLPDVRFKLVAFVYGLAIALLALAIPVSVQVLVESVANTGLLDAVLAVSLVLFVLLTGAAAFSALQLYVMDLFERRLFARLVAEIGSRLLYADLPRLENFDRDDLLNRYFEIHVLRSALPPLVTGASALLLQTVVGLLVVTFYHPFFFVYSVVYGVSILLVWLALDTPAVRTSIESSYAKYQVADWLETLARNLSFFKSERTMAYALAETERQNARFLKLHRRHFNYTFAQTIGFLACYVVGSVSLLALAGWLVIRGEMTLGQLVAAELILTGVFAGMSRFGYYLELHYDVCAAMDKLAVFYRLPLEPQAEAIRPPPADWPTSIEFRNVHQGQPGGTERFDLKFRAGGKYLLAAEDSALIKQLTDWLQRFREPDFGEILLGGYDIADFPPQALRNDIAVIDSPLILDCSIAEYLGLADPALSRTQMREALARVGFAPVLSDLPEDLDTRLLANGYPLYWTETLQVKLAYALLTRPKILILTPLIDSLRLEDRRGLLNYIRSLTDTTLLYFSSRRDLDLFDACLTLHSDRSAWFASLDGLRLSEGLPHLARAEEGQA